MDSLDFRIIDGKRQATYGHFDSYPTGLGQDIVDFILQLKREQYSLMIQRLRSIEVCKIIRDFYNTANLPPALFLADTYVPSESKMIPNPPRIFERDVASWDSLSLVAISDHIKQA